MPKIDGLVAKINRRCTPSRRIRLKARVDLGDQTAEFIPFEVISTAILTYFYLLLGTNVCILVSVINTRFQLDAPRRSNCSEAVVCLAATTLLLADLKPFTIGLPPQCRDLC